MQVTQPQVQNVQGDHVAKMAEEKINVYQVNSTNTSLLIDFNCDTN